MYLFEYSFEKCRASIMISDFLFLSGGRIISTVFILYIRSFLKQLSSDRSLSGTLVAQISLISTVLGSLVPNLITCLFWRTLSNFACCWSEMFPISSKKRVPPSAASNRPMRSSRASVNAPFLCPNNSLSKSVSVMAPRSTLTNGFDARLECWWMALATRSLPVPFSPSIRILASVGAIFSILKNTSSIDFDSPNSSDPIIELVLAMCCAELLLPFRLSASLSVSISFSLCHGFTTKSAAPSFNERTARSMSP